MNVPVWLKIGAVLVVLGGAVGFLLFGSGSEAFVWSKDVTQVVRNPRAYADRELRVEGLLKQGSVRFRESPCEWRFVLQKRNVEMPVQFPQCIVPDTFRDGMGITVTVQGRIADNGTFHASQVIPRCPSKYEMQQRQRNGEQMPHPAAPSPQTATTEPS